MTEFTDAVLDQLWDNGQMRAADITVALGGIPKPSDETHRKVCSAIHVLRECGRISSFGWGKGKAAVYSPIGVRAPTMDAEQTMDFIMSTYRGGTVFSKTSVSLDHQMHLPTVDDAIHRLLKVGLIMRTRHRTGRVGSRVPEYCVCRGRY